MSKIYVVIPSYNNFHLTHTLLWSLSRREKGNIEEVLVVNNGSTDNGETESGLKWWTDSKVGLPVRSLTLEPNVGFLKASNLGMIDVTNTSNDGDILILLSNDISINAPFISQIRDIIDGNSDSLVGGILYSSSTGWNEFEGNKVFPYLEGWLLATTILNWKKLDYFDEIYMPHIFEDIDLSTKALSLEMELVPLNNPGLVHTGGGTITYNEERHELTRNNKEKFRLKWIG